MRLKIIMVVVSVLVGLSLAECYVRVMNLGFHRGILLEGGNLLDYNFNGLYRYNSLLGWTPTPNVIQEKWGHQVHIDANGLRSNGQGAKALTSARVLAVGDSFTFGDEVDDASTWPARLESLLKEPVINAGVSSYGLDQSVLRAQHLIPTYKPKVLVIGLIYQDLVRCAEYIRHGVPKPIFIFKDNALLLQKPPQVFSPQPRLDWFKKIAGHSQLVTLLMDRWAHDYWWRNTNLDMRFIRMDVLPLAERLLVSINQVATLNQVKVVILVQSGIDVNKRDGDVLAALVQRVKSQCPLIEVVNVIPALLDLKENDPDKFKRLFIQDSFNHHMTREGNAWVAKQVAEVLF